MIPDTVELVGTAMEHMAENFQAFCKQTSTEKKTYYSNKSTNLL